MMTMTAFYPAAATSVDPGLMLLGGSLRRSYSISVIAPITRTPDS
jgi:hypothetical protein